MRSSNSKSCACPVCNWEITLRMTSGNTDGFEPGYREICSNANCNWEGDKIE